MPAYTKQLAGLTDKLFWRRTAAGYFHCFKTTGQGNPRVYISLCRELEIAGSGGQSCARPPAVMRCSRCDVAEINRRGKDESLPESPDWRAYHNWPEDTKV